MNMLFQKCLRCTIAVLICVMIIIFKVDSSLAETSHINSKSVCGPQLLDDMIDKDTRAVHVEVGFRTQDGLVSMIEGASDLESVAVAIDVDGQPSHLSGLDLVIEISDPESSDIKTRQTLTNDNPHVDLRKTSGPIYIRIHLAGCTTAGKWVNAELYKEILFRGNQTILNNLDSPESVRQNIPAAHIKEDSSRIPEKLSPVTKLSGTWKYMSELQSHPIKYAEVEVCIYNRLGLRRGCEVPVQTDTEGTFTVTFTRPIHVGQIVKASIYAKNRANVDVIKCKASLSISDRCRYKHEREITITNISPPHLVIAEAIPRSEAAAWYIYDLIGADSWKFLENHELTNEIRLVEVIWPASENAPTHYEPNDGHYTIHIQKADSQNRYVILHEYAHHIMNHLYGYILEDIQFSPPANHGFCTIEDKQIAWLEGWSDFLPSVILESENGKFVPSAHSCAYPLGVPSCGSSLTFNREGNVAHILWQIFSIIGTDQKPGLIGVIKTVMENEGNVHDNFETFAERLYKQLQKTRIRDQAGIEAILCNIGISDACKGPSLVIGQEGPTTPLFSFTILIPLSVQPQQCIPGLADDPRVPSFNQ